MPRSLRLFVILVLAVFSSVASVAQVQVGTPPFGSYAGGPDTVNLGNNNVRWVVPVIHKAGRGTDFSYDLTYDSSVWYPVTSGGATTWTPNQLRWVASTPTGGGGLTYKTQSKSCRFFQETQWITEYYTLYTNWVFTDALGTSHRMIGGIQDGGAPDCGPGDYAILTTNDGSGYKVDTNGTVYTVKGAVGSLGTGSYTDRNGNKITQSGGVFTDTLGSTALTVTGSGTASSPYIFTYTAPSGGSASYTMRYTTKTVKTNFGCSGIAEYGPTSNDLVSEIDLPDGTKYTINYESTPGFSGDVTGRIASIALPTGGTISYSYSGGSNGITCADGTAATLTRTTPDGTWTYAHSELSASHWQTKITSPADSQNSGSIGDDTVIDFQFDAAITSNTTSNTFETQRLAYQGSSTSGTLLRTTTICYNTNTANCTTTAVSSPITQRNVTTILPGVANLQSQSIYKYNSSGSLIEQDDYDWGSGAIGALLKKTAITMASLGNNISAFRQSVVVTNGSGTTVSHTNYNYDETGVVATSGTPQHVSVTGSRGNLTSINYYTNTSTYLTKRMSYFDTGRVQTVTDVNNAQTTYTYGACGNSFRTAVSEPLSLSKSMTWNCTGSVQLTSVDENNQTTTTAYSDLYFWRPASVTDPTSAAVSMTYPGETQAEAVMSFNSGASTSDALATLDGLGRRHLAQLRESPANSNFDSTETDYDTFGRTSRVTLPYVGAAGASNSSAPAQTTIYDALNRVLKISDASTGYRSYSYSQNDVYVTRGPAPTGENTKRRQEEYDALGRLTSVCEITSGTGSGTCGQRTAQTGFWTKYTYDALGRITGVTQNAQSASPQTRTYLYDLMGRLTSETNPENGTTTYTWDSANIGVCNITSKGDLIMRTNAAGVSTCNGYDALHRLLSVGHNPAQANGTPDRFFVYDAATVNGTAMVNTKGRLAEAYTCMSPCTKLTDEGFSYTVRGETSDVYESTQHSNGYYHVTAQYWANSAPKQLSGVPSLPTMTYTPDGEGRVYKVSASSGQNPVTNTVFNAASLPTSITYGSLDSDSFTYDPNTNRLTQYKFTVGSTPQSLIGNLTWNPNHTLASQNITDPFDGADQQNCSYTHDDITRLASVNCGAIFSQTFSYDAFGNISKSGTYSFQPTYNSATNRFSSIPGTTVSYDTNGNVLSDGSHTYTWDADAHPLTTDSVALTYDAFGRMVEQNRSGAYTEILYGPRNYKLALMNGQTLTKGLINLPGGGNAVYSSSGLLYYGHSDHLGSAKFASTPSRTMYFDLAYAPFGETYAATGTTDPAFTGQRQDTVPGLFDFPERQYSTQGRWPTPDPSGLASVNLHDPQQLNRYAYVRNNPLSLVDPTGLVCNGVNQTMWDTLANGTGIFTPEDCAANGGTWFEPEPPAPDPTSGGDPGNAGGDVCGIGSLCTDSNGGLYTSMDQNDLMTVVTANLSDQPDVQTEDVAITDSLQEPNTDSLQGTILGQMLNKNQCSDCMSVINGANTAVEAMGYAELTGASIVVGGPYWQQILAITVSASLIGEQLAATSGTENELNGPPTGPHPLDNEPNGGGTFRETAPISGDPPEEFVP
jgi:RHS repeat-associated protein